MSNNTATETTSEESTTSQTTNTEHVSGAACGREVKTKLKRVVANCDHIIEKLSKPGDISDLAPRAGLPGWQSCLVVQSNSLLATSRSARLNVATAKPGSSSERLALLSNTGIQDILATMQGSDDERRACALALTQLIDVRVGDVLEDARHEWEQSNLVTVARLEAQCIEMARCGCPMCYIETSLDAIEEAVEVIKESSGSPALPLAYLQKATAAAVAVGDPLEEHSPGCMRHAMQEAVEAINEASEVLAKGWEHRGEALPSIERAEASCEAAHDIAYAKFAEDLPESASA